MKITEHAPAKLNLTLRVTGRRDDGYHLLDSLVGFTELGDTLAVEPAESLSLAIEGPFAPALKAEPDNLVLRAARMLAEAAGFVPRARLTLTKRLPVASGIGGGSSDAAAALRALARLWGTAVPLLPLAARLGADVPVCLAGRSCRMRGIGETIEPLALPATDLVLVNPGRPLATAAVFAARTAAFSPAFAPSGGDLAAMVTAGGNDLAAPARGLCPDIDEVLSVLAELPGCRAAAMSGSGATCFALFDRAPDAAFLSLAYPAWWVATTRLAASPASAVRGG